MIEIILNFERIIGRFVPWILIASGVIFTILGLSIWISGLALRKILISLAGLASGFLAGLFVIGRNLFSAGLTGALSALIALIFEKVLTVLLAAALAAAITFIFVAEPYFEKTETTAMQIDTSDQTETIDIKDISYEMKHFGLNAGEKIRRAGMNLPLERWIIIGAPAVVFLICGIFLWRFTTALSFSVIGTMVVYIGMILLLSYKGTEPISHIRNKPLIAGVTFLAMTGFGTVAQLLLCKKSKKEKITTIKPGSISSKNKEGSEKIVEHDWRSA
jgi:hypothetical protein